MFTKANYRDRQPISGCLRLWLRLGVDNKGPHVISWGDETVFIW